MSIGRRALASMSAGILGFVVAFSSVPAQAQQKETPKKLDKAQQQDVEALAKALDMAQAGQEVASDFPTSIDGFDSLRASNGAAYVPFTVKVDDKAMANQPVALMFRVVGDNAKTVAATADIAAKADGEKKGNAPANAAAYQDIAFLALPAAIAEQPIRLRRAFQIAPGQYQVYFAMKDRNNGDKKQKARMAVCRQTVTVPDYNGEMTTSSVIVAEKIDVLPKPLPADQQRDNPYTIGQLQIQPKVGTDFAKTQELSVYFQIYNEALDAARKPNVRVDFAFYREAEGGAEKKVANSEPQILNATTLAPQFDVAIHQLPGGSGWPLTTFAPGKYRLEILVTDKISGKTVTRNVKFSVS